jgi:hypothetical protein
MSSAHPATIAIATGSMLAVGGVVALAGILPALVVLWTGSLVGVLVVFVYEGREQQEEVAVVSLDRVEPAVSPVPETLLVDLTDSGTDGPHGKLTHRHRRHQSPEALRARV